tara:strand:- start:540 stop:1397 length:858 start_codon:yes stop_codon:yes gene_type:complete
MIAYLNGVNVLNGKKKFRPFGGKGKKALTKLKATGKKLNEKRKALDKKIIAKHKALAKKVGAGIKRFAKIGRTLQEKALVKALEKNLMGLSSRLKATYKVSPQSVKTLLKPMGDWEKLKSAINKGDKKQPAIIGEYRTLNRKRIQKNYTGNFPNTFKKYKSYLGEDEPTGGADAEATAENVKQGVNLITKIVEFFKKRKESKAGDAETIEAMSNSVDADPNIEKVDENGKSLPVSDEAKEIDKIDKETGKAEQEEKGGGLMSNKPLLIGGALALAVGGYFLMKKK